MIISTQTAQQKHEAYADFLRRMVEQGLQGLQDDIHNFTLITNWIEQMGVPVAHDSMVKAINANSQLLHWLPSQGEQQRQQQAVEAQKRHAAEVDRILDGFCLEHPEFVRCDENLSLLVKFVKEQHHGVLGEVQIEHFWRIFQDSPELVRRASNAPVLSAGLLRPKDDTEERRAEAKGRREQEAATIEARANFELAVKKAVSITIDASNGRGIRWSDTSAARVQALEAAARQWPQWSSECKRLIVKERSRFRF